MDNFKIVNTKEAIDILLDYGWNETAYADLYYLVDISTKKVTKLVDASFSDIINARKYRGIFLIIEKIVGETGKGK